MITLGMTVGSSLNMLSYSILVSRLSNQLPKPLLDTKENFFHGSGTLFKAMELMIDSIFSEIVRSPLIP